MYFLAASFLFSILAAPFTAYCFSPELVPETLGSEPVLTLTDEVQTWSPDNMYEHVNGEAELLIRHGTSGLAFAAWENETGAYVSVDIIDLQKPINAYGLYRLYTGCETEDATIQGVTVHLDDYTNYAVYGQYFLRINLDTGDQSEHNSALLENFLSHFVARLPEQAPLPAALEILQQHALRPCEVNYHPDQIDYDLETGPGYSWVGKDGATYYAILLDSEQGAARKSEELKNRGVGPMARWKQAVVWKSADQGEAADYLKEIATQIARN